MNERRLAGIVLFVSAPTAFIEYLISPLVFVGLLNALSSGNSDVLRHYLLYLVAYAVGLVFLIGIIRIIANRLSQSKRVLVWLCAVLSALFVPLCSFDSTSDSVGHLIYLYLPLIVAVLSVVGFCISVSNSD